MPTRLFPTLVVATAVAAFPWLQPVRAAELKDMTISVIGLPSMVNGWKYVQQPALHQEHSRGFGRQDQVRRQTARSGGNRHQARRRASPPTA